MNEDMTINIEGDSEAKQPVRTVVELILNDEQGEQRFPICYTETILGSAKERDIVLKKEGLASKQLSFHFRDEKLFITNLESSVPVLINGIQASFAPLVDGDQISFLGCTILVAWLEKSLARLEGCSEPYLNRVWSIGKEPATIGRGSTKRDNLVKLDDRTISRAQATIHCSEDNFYLQADTGNSPIRVNGEKVSGRQDLSNGDLLQMGQLLFRFRLNQVEKQRRDLMSQEATILFSDVWNYSSFSESRPLEDTINQMNEFYSGLGKVIKAHNGILLTFLGDAMMAVFGSETEDASGPSEAVLAALSMQEKLGELNQAWRSQSRPQLEAGIGINTGEVMVGDVGFTGKYEFAAMGDNTNLAARVEKLTRERGTKIIITGSTKAMLNKSFKLRSLGATKVKGREAEVDLYAVDGCQEAT